MILDEVIGGAGEVTGIQVMGDRYKAGISGVIFVKLQETFVMGQFMLKFRGVSFRGHYVSAKYAQREFDEESLPRRDRHGMNEGNKLIYGHELSHMVLSEDVYEEPSERWIQGVLDQMGKGESALYFTPLGERIMANCEVIGLPRADGQSSSAGAQRAEKQHEHANSK